MHYDDYKRVGLPWDDEEDLKLNDLYNNKQKDILEISELHMRAPGGIISRLIRNEIITNRISARGYEDYKNSELYKEICLRNRSNIKKKKEDLSLELLNRKNQNILITMNKNDFMLLQNDIDDVKSEIKELKLICKNIVEMFNAVYEFEN